MHVLNPNACAHVEWRAADGWLFAHPPEYNFELSFQLRSLQEDRADLAHCLWIPDPEAAVPEYKLTNISFHRFEAGLYDQTIASMFDAEMYQSVRSLARMCMFARQHLSHEYVINLGGRMTSVTNILPSSIDVLMEEMPRPISFRRTPLEDASRAGITGLWPQVTELCAHIWTALGCWRGA